MATLNVNTRNTVADVRDILDTEMTDEQLAAFINTAYVVVSTNLSDKGLAAAILTEIEKYLSAHFASLRDQRAQSEGIAGEYNVTYQGKTDMGFNATQYGQMAVALDTSGVLATMGSSKKRASFIVFDTPRHGTYPNQANGG